MLTERDLLTTRETPPRHEFLATGSAEPSPGSPSGSWGSPRVSSLPPPRDQRRRLGCRSATDHPRVLRQRPRAEHRRVRLPGRGRRASCSASNSATARWRSCRPWPTRSTWTRSCSRTCTPTTAPTSARSPSCGATTRRRRTRRARACCRCTRRRTRRCGSRTRTRPTRPSGPSPTSPTSTTSGRCGPSRSGSGRSRCVAVEVDHPTPAYGLRISYGGRILAFTGDTGPCAALNELADGVDLLLAEASWTDSAERPAGVHLSGKQAGELARDAAVGRLLLTHIAPWTDAGAVLAEASAEFPGGRGRQAGCRLRRLSAPVLECSRGSKRWQERRPAP